MSGLLFPAVRVNSSLATLVRQHAAQESDSPPTPTVLQQPLPVVHDSHCAPAAPVCRAQLHRAAVGTDTPGRQERGAPEPE